MKTIKTFISIILVAITCSWIPVDFLTDIENRYQLFKEKYPYTFIDLSFNQPSYSPGDTVFFSMRYLYENYQPVKGTSLVNVNLISGEGTLVKSVRFKILDGLGSNQLVIPEDIDPGVYKLIAFTDWMRNFGAEAFFHSTLPVVSRYKFSNSYVLDKPVQFYSEGGHLIELLPNKVLVTGSAGITVPIYDDLGNIVENVTLNKFGVGTFLLTPENGKNYYGSSKNKKIQLPPTEEDGIAIRFALESQEKMVNLSIKKRSKYFNQKTFLLLLSEGNILLKQEIVFNENGMVNLRLPANNKARAVHQLYILDASGKELCQRVFVPTVSSNINVNVESKKNTKQRELFSFGVSVVNEEGKLVESDISISVFQKNLFKDTTNSYVDILSTLHTKKYNSDAEPFLNDILISKKWTRINWESLLDGKSPDFQFPFINKIKLIGSVLSKENGKPAPDSTQVIAYLLKNTMGYEAYTKDGDFEIPLIFDFWDDDAVFVSARNKSKCIDDQYSISLREDIIEMNDRWKSEETDFLDLYASYSLKKNLVLKSFNFFEKKNSEIESLKSPNEVLEEEFQGVDQISKIADYVVFPTMEDLLKEVVPFVQVKKRGADKTVQLYYRYEKSVLFYKHDPVYVVDGKMTTNTEKFLGFKPEELLSIKVINNPNKLAQLGSLGQYGIIFIESKKGNLLKEPSENIFPVVGLSKSTWASHKEEFNSELHSGIPSLRSTLYWNPSMKADSKEPIHVNFMTSDDVGLMRVEINGLTKDGRLFFGQSSFSVELNSNRK